MLFFKGWFYFLAYLCNISWCWFYIYMVEENEKVIRIDLEGVNRKWEKIMIILYCIYFLKILEKIININF